MADPSRKAKGALEQEAARIVLAYRDEDRLARDAALHAWSRGDPDRAAAADRALRMWIAMAPQERERPRKSRRRLAYGMVAIATSVSLALWLTAPFGADFASGGDVIAELQIAPGVMSALDSGTALNVIENDDDVLSIELRSGALFLAVDRSKRKRVTVIAGGVTTKVTGTRFSVARLSGSVSVAVEEGSVSVGVAAQDDANAVIAGSAWIGTERGGAVVPVNVSEIASWRQGVLTVRNRPLRDVADILARRFTGQILFADATLANARVSGSFDLADPIEALRAAVSALDGRVMTVTPWLAIVAPK